MPVTESADASGTSQDAAHPVNDTSVKDLVVEEDLRHVGPQPWGHTNKGLHVNSEAWPRGRLFSFVPLKQRNSAKMLLTDSISNDALQFRT